MSATPPALLSAIEHHQRRVWALCYRMTGRVTVADDLAQEALARAIERSGQLRDDEAAEGWLYRVATTTCLDWLRRQRVETGLVRVVDPIELRDLPCTSTAHSDPEAGLLRRDDLRVGVLSTLQALPLKQRAVLVLRDVLDRSTEETALALDTTEGNVKVLLHRAREALAAAHRVRDVEVPAERAVVERFASALQSNSTEEVLALLADEAWGIVDDGDPHRKPTLGKLAVAKQWGNAVRRFAQAASIEHVALNGEPALRVRVAGVWFASIHLETWRGLVASTRVLRDLGRLATLASRASAHDR